MTDEELTLRFEHIEQRFAELDKRFDESVELTRSIETTLLKAFRNWALRFESRFKANEVLVRGFDERLAALEERVDDIEQKGGPEAR
jgi:hypothetical protein